MKKKILFLTFFLITILFVFNNKSMAATNPYPIDGITGSTGEYSNCTWTVWKIVSEELKIDLPNWSSASKWYDNAKKSGYPVGKDPQAYSVACFASHVAYVQEVSGTKVFLREGGWGTGANRGYNERWIESSKVTVGFIYLNPKWYNLLELTDLGDELYGSIMINDSKVVENNKSLVLNNDIEETDLSYVWNFQKKGSNTYVIRNMATNRYIDVMNFGDTDGATIDTMTYNGSNAQKFYIYLSKSGKYILRPKHSERVLNLGESQIDLWSYDEEKDQCFTFSEVPEALVKENTIVPKVCGLKRSNMTTNSITLSWKEEPLVDRYSLYIAESEEGPFTFAKTITKNTETSYDFTDLTPGKTYYFKVWGYRILYGGKKFAPYSDVLWATTRTLTPQISSLTSGSKKAIIKWLDVDGATGYEIHMSTSKNSGYTRIVNVAYGKQTYTKKSLKSKKTYYFKIRAYRTVNGTKYFSPYSTIKSVYVK